ncbi:helix-turn-helix domain-containing protein [Streptomyces sp. CA-106131]|uniref:helix-turn-helix domain-containing protein n=1 Tax=Streptomyces sp. CA-106131 TaxID=3240045 RepID=UPI003D8DAE8D
MEHSLEPQDPVDTIRFRVKQLRGHRGWTGAELGERLTRLGVPWDRSIVANFEAGRRRTVSVTELMALSMVFDVAPVNLLVPLDNRPYKITPERTEGGDIVRAWVRGEDPLPGMDDRTFYTEISGQDMRRRMGFIRENYELGPHPVDEPVDDKIAREGWRMRRQNKPLQDSGEE